ncbi:hypothetical protein BgiMline_031575, partial [Biomphalaria glabrata]
MLQRRVNCSCLLKWAILCHLLSQTLSYEFHFFYELDEITYNKFGRKWTLWTNGEDNESCKEHDASLNLNCTVKERVIKFKKISNEITGNYILTPDAQNDETKLINCEIHRTGGTEHIFNMSVNCSFDSDFTFSTFRFTKKLKEIKDDFNNLSFELKIQGTKGRKEYQSKLWCIVNINVSNNTEILQAFIIDTSGKVANVELLVNKSSYMSSELVLEKKSTYYLPGLNDTNATVILRVEKVSVNTSKSAIGSYGNEINKDADPKYLEYILGVLSAIIFTVPVTI